MSFQPTTIIKYSVLALCLLFMAFVIWKLYRDNLGVTAEDGIYWPPEINRCPDYWTYKSDGKCHNDNFNFTIDPLMISTPVTEDDLIAKCSDLKDKYPGVAWEGIDNLC